MQSHSGTALVHLCPRVCDDFLDLFDRVKQLPSEENILYLNGENKGIVNNLCFPGTVAPSYGKVSFVAYLTCPFLVCLDMSSCGRS